MLILIHNYMKVVLKTFSFVLVLSLVGMTENLKPVTANIQLAQTPGKVKKKVNNSPIPLALPIKADIKLKNGDSMTARVTGFDSKGKKIEFSYGKTSKSLPVAQVQQVVFRKDKDSLVYTATGSLVIRGEDNSKATQSEWSNLPLQAFELVDSQRGQAKVDLATIKKPQELSQIQSVAVKSLYIADEIQFSSTGKITIKVTPADKR
ncbi:MAG: hypothetical protein HEQ25_00510 [Dolichospermum sp. DET73]|nr:hypothetical protein [Dolichospermum sp. DET73]